MDGLNIKTELQKLTQPELRLFADQNGFDFYALLDVVYGRLKVNAYHELRIKQAILTSGIKSGC